MGISDIIAGFIQQELEEAGGALELQRSDLAQRFNCVPSQINYVMSTRFSPERGYIVESRRGGGGYIRITRVQVDRQTLLMHVINSIGGTLITPAHGPSPRIWWNPRLSAGSWGRRFCPPPASRRCTPSPRSSATRCGPIFLSRS